MRVRWTLLWWMLRPTTPLTVSAAGVLFTAPLLAWPSGIFAHRWQDSFEIGFLSIGILAVLGHAVFVPVYLGRYCSGRMAYLYSRGLSRNALWAHIMLASAVAVLVSIIAAELGFACALALGARSFAAHMRNELLMDALWFGARAVGIQVPLIAVLHFAWMRGAQPDRNSPDGYWLAVMWLWASLTTLVDVGTGTNVLVGLAVWFGLPAVLLLLSSRLHRSIEVRA